jgi:hypothetical protein
VACVGEGNKVYGVLVGKPEGKRLLKILRHRWEQSGCRVDPVGSG